MNPHVLRWARESAGLSPSQAVRKLGLKNAYGVEPAARLRAYEEGREFPTRAMLVKMAAGYQQPLVSLYLNEPPPKGDRGTDFRTTPEGEWTNEEEAWLDILLRDLKARQSVLKEALLDNEEREPLPFIGSIRYGDDLQRGLDALYEILGVSHVEYRRERRVEDAFRLLRRCAENARVFVLLIGDLGHHSRTIGVEVFRGLVMADEIAPIIVINPGDSPGARSFTLLHELVHLCLGHSGVSDWSTGSKVEQFCSDVASQYLLPEDDLDRLAALNHQGDEWVSAIDQFARGRNLSSALVAYRLYRRGTLSRDVWGSLRKHFSARWKELKAQLKEAKKQVGDGGPGYYTTTRFKLGQHLVGTTGRLMRAGALTTTKAGFVLDVRPQNVHRLTES